MYREAIEFDKDSYLEVVSRITNGGESLMLSLRGLKNDDQVTMASVMLDPGEVALLITHLNDWLATDPSNRDLAALQ